MKKLRELSIFLAAGFLLSLVPASCFLLYWYAPHPWDHVGTILGGGVAFGFVVWLFTFDDPK